jgi:chemotaxis protein MotB
MDIEVKDETAPGPGLTRQAWMVTFVDLVCLTLTFFVMLFAMANVKLDQWRSMVDALSQTLNPSLDRTKAPATAPFNIGAIFRRQSVNLDYLAAILKETVAKDPLLEKSQFMRLGDRLIIALAGDRLFEPGRAVLTERAREAVFTLGGVLRNIGNQIGVSGHADPLLPEADTYASHWELSLARAAAVANLLARAGYPETVLVFGHADTRYRHLPAALSDEQRRALGQRIEIVILPTVAIR